MELRASASIRFASEELLAGSSRMPSQMREMPQEPRCWGDGRVGRRRLHISVHIILQVLDETSIVIELGHRNFVQLNQQPAFSDEHTLILGLE